MHIKIRNKVITTPIEQILKVAQSELKNGKLRNIDNRNKTNILISCPVHSDGLESNPSCRIFTDTSNPYLEAGYAHCFSCGYKGSLAETISELFDELDPKFGEDWLIERFGDTFIQVEEYLPEIDISPKAAKKFMDEKELEKYDYYHPYMWKRKLSKEVVDRFRVGYDKEREAITFPVYDEKHRLVMVTARSVNTKQFYIPAGADKPVYLLYDIIERGVTSVCITEAQIDALTAWTFGYPCVATMGSPSAKQINAINKSGIRHLILMFDNDAAGKRFSEKLKRSIRHDIFISEVRFPHNVKDINDLTKDQFDYMIKNLI